MPDLNDLALIEALDEITAYTNADGDEQSLTDEVLAVLSAHRIAVLAAIFGADNVHEIRMPEWFNPGHTTDFQAIHVGRENSRYGFDALVVVLPTPTGDADAS